MEKKISELPIVFFDGECAFCNACVEFLARKDKEKKLHYAPLGGKTFFSLGLHNQNLPQSVLFYFQGKIYVKSQAIYKISQFLPFPYPLFSKVFKIIPTSLLDMVYDFVAQKRSRLLKKKPKCRFPQAFSQHLFLD